ncbi:MAG: NAD(P)-binding protein [Bacteroidales bacterium]|nr:NAD(P)-binding protein [Bacteroidales bacterium]
MYDILIVGGGLGGLLSGYVLSKEGYKVCIVEKNHQLGGCLQTFVRDKCVFDTGMHYVGSMAEGQILWRFFKYFDLIDKVKFKKLDEDGFDIINIGEKDYKYAQGYDNFKETMLRNFPDENEALTNYINKLKEIKNSFNNYSSSRLDLNTSSIQYFGINTFDYLKSITNNTRLQNVLAGLNALYAGKPESNPLYVHAIINNSFIESAWRLIDGGEQITNHLADSIKANGGTILKRSEVKRFVMNQSDELIEKVELKNGEQIEAKKFISNVHPVKTFEMVKSNRIKKAYINRINSIEHSISIFSIYIVFKENSFKYFNYNYYHYKGEDSWGVRAYDASKWPEGYMAYTPATSKSDVYADSMIVMTYMKYDELKQWENTTVEKRGEEYLEFKRKKAEQLLNLMEERFPNLRSHIKAYYTSTPLTYRDYVGTINGSIYGILKDSSNPFKTLIFPRTKIPNLLLTGQNINMHGLLGVSMGAFMTCGELVGLKYLFGKINN